VGINPNPTNPKLCSGREYELHRVVQESCFKLQFHGTCLLQVCTYNVGINPNPTNPKLCS
jgi:hypothetical protein